MSETHGGKRKGAGRKPGTEQNPRAGKKGITIHVEPEIAEKFSANCKRRGITQEQGFTYFVRALPG